MPPSLELVEAQLTPTLWRDKAFEVSEKKNKQRPLVLKSREFFVPLLLFLHLQYTLCAGGGGNLKSLLSQMTFILHSSL